MWRTFTAAGVPERPPASAGTGKARGENNFPFFCGTRLRLVSLTWADDTECRATVGGGLGHVSK